MSKSNDALSKNLSELEILNGKVINFICANINKEINEALQFRFNTLFEEYTEKLEYIETMFGLHETVIAQYCDMDLPDDVDYTYVCEVLMDYTEGYILSNIEPHYEGKEDQFLN